MIRLSDLPVCEVIAMPRTQAELARNRLQAAIDEYDATAPPPMTDVDTYNRWAADTSKRLGCGTAAAHRIWQATMLGMITQAARTCLEETAP